MKKTISIALSAIFFATTTPEMGCSPSSKSTPVPSVSLPDISNFTINAVSSFVAGASTLISIASTTLADGTYTVYFDLTGANNITNASATLSMSGDVATFNTPVLANSGNTDIKITRIVNSSGGSRTFTSAPTWSFADSTGQVVCNVGTAYFRASDVDVTKTGSMLTIHAVIWEPELTTMNLHIDYFANTTGSTYFNENDLSFNGNNNSCFNGGASYNGPLGIIPAKHGVITITSLSPVITGTFSFIGDDSTSVSSGTFKGKL